MRSTNSMHRNRNIAVRFDDSADYRGDTSCPSASMLHLVKSIGFPHPEQVCWRLNSSEKISFSFPQLGHLQVNELRFLSS